MTTRKRPEGKMKDLADAKRSKGVLIPELRKVALATADDGHPGGWDHIHPSEMAKADWCPRSTYYRICTGKEHSGSFSFVMENIFDEGHDIEAKWQERMRQTKKLWGSWECMICKQWSHGCWEPESMAGRCLVGGIMHIWQYKEVRLRDTESLIWGQEDGGIWARDDYRLENPPYMVEIKSIGAGTLRMDAPDLLKKHYAETVSGGMMYDYESIWRDLNRPLLAHVKQANVYLWLARQMGLPFTSVRFLYEFKFNQQVKEFAITLSDDIIQPLLTKAAEVRYALGKVNDPPECPANGCKHCEPYEEKNGPAKDLPAGSGRGGGASPSVPSGRVRRSSPPVSGAGDRRQPVGATARRRAAGRPPGRDGAGRPRPDESLPVDRPVGQVPDSPVSGSGGRRVFRRKGPDQD
jgi:hypothetical protein